MLRSVFSFLFQQDKYLALCFAIKLYQFVPVLISDRLGTACETVTHCLAAGLSFRSLFGHGNNLLEVACGPEAFDLRFQQPESIGLLLDYVIYGYYYVRFKRIRLLESVREIKEDGILRYLWDIRAIKSYRGHVCGVLHQDACITMVGMVIVRAMSHYNICFPFPDEAHEYFGVFQGRHQLAIVNVQHLGLDAQFFCRRLNFSGAPLG